MTIDVDTLGLATVDVTAEASTPATYEAQAMLQKGTAIIGASFLNDFYDAANGIDRNLVVDWVEVEGPLGASSDNPLRSRIMVCEPDPRLRDGLSEVFGLRPPGLRRPLQRRDRRAGYVRDRRDRRRRRRRLRDAAPLGRCDVAQFLFGSSTTRPWSLASIRKTARAGLAPS